MYNAFMKYIQGYQYINIKAECCEHTNEDTKYNHQHLSAFKITPDHHSFWAPVSLSLKTERKEERKREKERCRVTILTEIKSSRNWKQCNSA